MRKMILTGALVLFGAGTTPQVVAALTVCIAWFALIANLKPFGEDVDDRLAQVEGLQVLFTLLIGLVLQLEATAEETSGQDDTNLGYVLIALNGVVVGLALIQQPIVLTVAARLAVLPRRIVVKLLAKRNWEKVWVVNPDGQDGARTLDVWCDVASHPPRVLDSAPLALVAKRPMFGAKAWNFDSDGKVLIHPRLTTDNRDGSARWIDVDRKSLLDTPPIQLFETAHFSRSTQWLDTETQTLLRAQPGLLVAEEPEVHAGDTPIILWRHRKDGTLMSADPSGEAGEEVRSGDDAWSQNFAALVVGVTPTSLTPTSPSQGRTIRILDTCSSRSTVLSEDPAVADTPHLTRAASFKDRTVAIKAKRDKRMLARRLRRNAQRAAEEAEKGIEMAANPLRRGDADGSSSY